VRREAARFALVLAAAVLLASVMFACGGSDDSTQSTAGGTQAETAATTESQGSPQNGKKGSAGFITPGGDNSIQKFGEEADGAELEAATSVLESYMRAFAAGDWAKSCSYLSDSQAKSLQQFAAGTSKLEGKGCAALLPLLVAGAPASARANTLVDGIASLRVGGGERAFALYHGPKGVDYFIPMAKQGGTWKVATLSPQEFP
jgi:hypothetical protein